MSGRSNQVFIGTVEKTVILLHNTFKSLYLERSTLPSMGIISKHSHIQFNETRNSLMLLFGETKENMIYLPPSSLNLMKVLCASIVINSKKIEKNAY